MRCCFLTIQGPGWLNRWPGSVISRVFSVFFPEKLEVGVCEVRLE